MKNLFLPLLPLLVFVLVVSCEPENSGDNEPEPPVAEDIIEIPDEHFKAALVSTNSIDTDGDRVGDSNIDLNDDGEIQRSEGERIEGLIINFNNENITSSIDLSGIENFVNLKYLKLTGFSFFPVEETPESELMIYDFTDLKKLELLELNNLTTNHYKALDLTGLSNLREVIMINNRPYYEVFDEHNIHLPVNFMDVHLEGTDNLTDLDITNSFLNIDFCEVPSLKRLNMFYLEGGEPEVFDFHCLTELEWLDIGENYIDALILKNSSVLSTLLTRDIGASNNGNYPFVEYICVDDLSEEFEQIIPIRNENTVVVTDCTF